MNIYAKQKSPSLSRLPSPKAANVHNRGWVSCKKIHISIACLVHQIEQTSLDRLAIVFSCHFILLLFQDNFSKYWQP